MNIRINGNDIQSSRKYIEDVTSVSLISLESFNDKTNFYYDFVPPKISLENCINIYNRSTEADNIESNSTYDEKKVSVGTKIIRYISTLFDNFYRHIVSFIKAIVNFFKKAIAFISGKDELKQIKILPEQNYVTITGFRGLKRIQSKIPIEEFRRSTKLTDENKMMVRCQKEQEYLASIEKLVNYIHSAYKLFLSNSKDAEQAVGSLNEAAEQFKKLNFVNVTSDKDYITNVQTFLENPSAISKNISTKVVEKTKSLEYLPSSVQKVKDELIKKLEENPQMAQEISPKIKLASALFTSITTIDNLILKSSSGYISILQEINYLVNREIHSEDGIFNGLMYLNRDVKVVNYGSELFAIPFNFTLKRSEETAAEFDKVLIIARHCNEISHSGKGQTIDHKIVDGKDTIVQSERSQWTAKFMAWLRENSREVKAVVGNDEHYNIYEFNIKIEEEGGKPSILKCWGNVFKDNRKTLKNMPDKVYHTTDMDKPELDIMPNTGNYGAHADDMKGINGIGFTSSRVYAAISPCTRQGIPISTMLNLFVKKASQIEDALKSGKYKSSEIKQAVSQLEKTGKPLEESHVYEIDNVKQFEGHVFVDPEHRGGMSGKVQSLLTGNTEIEPAIYIETEKPLTGKNVTKQLFKTLEHNSQFPNLYKYCVQNKSALLKWFFNT